MGGLTPSGAKCFVDYVFLDTDERKKFAQTKHEYLIEQVQNSHNKLTQAGQTTKAILSLTTQLRNCMVHPTKDHPGKQHIFQCL